MKNENVETLVQESKPEEVKKYVKPTVTKHTAASLLVGSGGICGMYVSSAVDCAVPSAAYYY